MWKRVILSIFCRLNLFFKVRYNRLIGVKVLDRRYKSQYRSDDLNRTFDKVTSTVGYKQWDKIWLNFKWLWTGHRPKSLKIVQLKSEQSIRIAQHDFYIKMCSETKFYIFFLKLFTIL